MTDRPISAVAALIALIIGAGDMPANIE